jgi:hypothetical protein
MPGSASDVVEADLLKLLTGQATTIFTSTPLAHIYIGLATTVYADASGSNTEVPSTNGYARVDSKGSWAAPTGTSPCQTSNSAALTFPTATGAWASSAPIKSFLAFDASTGGNFLFGGDLTDITKTVTTAGDTISFPIGSLIGQLD